MSSTRASSRWSRQSARSGSSARCSVTGQVGPVLVGGLEQDVEVAHGAEPRARSRAGRSGSASSGRAGTTRRRPATPRAGGASRRASRGAPRGRCRSRVPASRASIRARWKRMTLRPASATWSSAVTPGGLADDRRGGVGGRRASRSTRRRRPTSMDDVGRGRRWARLPRARHRSSAAPSSSSAAVAFCGELRVLVGVVGPARSSDAPPSFVLARLHRGERRLELAAVRDAAGPVGGEGRRRAPTSRSSSPFVSSASSSTNRSTTRAAATTSTSSRLSSTRVDAVAQLALAAQLADRHELDQRRVAGVLEHQRPGVRGRPVDGPRGPVGRALELLAADGAAGALRRGERLDRDDAPRPDWRSRTAKPARARAPSAVST